MVFSSAARSEVILEFLKHQGLSYMSGRGPGQAGGRTDTLSGSPSLKQGPPSIVPTRLGSVPVIGARA